ALEGQKEWVLRVCCDRISSLKRREENQRARVPWQAVFRLEIEKNPAELQQGFSGNSTEQQQEIATRNSNKKQQKSNRPRRPDRPEIMPRNDAD
ncbi:MAG: hypothetical protein VW831_13820, partial [Gammaproteobacteria bacterium]